MIRDRDFSTALLAWYQVHKRPMPWRESRDPYHIWLSEVMLQQTQVATVIPYYKRFLDRFPCIEDIAHADDDDVLKLWEGLGYYRRCHHFLEAVRIVCRNHQGRVPDDPDLFSKLPGVGAYTTAAVMSIAFGQALPVVDGNVVRVIARYDCIEEDSSKNATRKRIHTRMGHLIPNHMPGDFNQAVMELGATICLPKNPLCKECPVSDGCCAFKADTVICYPNVPKKNPIPEFQVGLAVIVRDRHFLIQKRPSNGHLAGMWEFPGGKALNGESVEDALQRKCLEELGMNVRIVEKIARVSHVYSHFRIYLSVYICQAHVQDIKPLKNQPLMWITSDDLDTYPFPAANHKFFASLRKKCYIEP